jgi:RNA polymerase-binding protein DksA
MKDSDLKHFRQRLLDMGKQLKGEVDSLQAESLRQTGGEASGGLSNAPLHPADLGSDTFEQEMNLELLENEERSLEEVAEALARIDRGEYGRCENCGREISLERLEALPATRYCVDCARQNQRA